MLKMRKKFQDIEVAVNERMKQIFDQLSERGKNYSSENFEYEDECIEHSEEADMSTHFLRIQKNQLIDLKQHLERYLNTLPIFGFNRLTLRIWSCLSIKKQDQNVTLRAFSHLENRKQSIGYFNVNGYCDHCKTVFEATGWYYHFCSCQEVGPTFT